MQDHDQTIADYPRRGEILEEKYEIQEVLGAGAMGSVVRARHLLRKVPVALKFMSPSILGQPEVVERFLNEAVASSKIDSEHVVKVFDVGKLPNGVPYIVMEFLEGEDLSKMMRREGHPHLDDVSRAVHLTLQMLRGLQAAHKVKIVHRDMKPANCFITGKDGDADFIKIVDFGISKIRQDDAAGLELTGAGAALGTPLYMSLEQARSPRDVDARSDLYSVAVILYEMLVGVTPFVPMSGTLSELFTMLALEDPKPIDQYRSDLPLGLADVVRKGLHKDRDQRYQTAQQFAEALAPFADDRSDYVVARLLRTTNAGNKSRPPPAGSIPPQASATGTLMMSKGAAASLASGRITGRSTAQSALPRTQREETPTIDATVATTAQVASTTQGTVREARAEEKKSSPMVWAIGAVAVAAIGAMAVVVWALGKVTTTTPPAAAAPAAEAKSTTAESPSPTVSPGPSSSALASASASASTSASVAPSSTATTRTPLTSASPSPFPTPSPPTSGKKLNQITRDQ